MYSLRTKIPIILWVTSLHNRILCAKFPVPYEERLNVEFTA